MKQLNLFNSRNWPGSLMTVEEWMGRLRTAAVKCNYQEIDRQLKEQFIQN